MPEVRLNASCLEVCTCKITHFVSWHHTNCYRGYCNVLWRSDIHRKQFIDQKCDANGWYPWWFYASLWVKSKETQHLQAHLLRLAKYKKKKIVKLKHNYWFSFLEIFHVSWEAAGISLFKEALVFDLKKRKEDRGQGCENTTQSEFWTWWETHWAALAHDFFYVGIHFLKYLSILNSPGGSGCCITQTHHQLVVWHGNYSVVNINSLCFFI